MKIKVSKLFAVTLFTPKRIVRSSLPWDVLNPVLRTKATHPLSTATLQARGGLLRGNVLYHLGAPKDDMQPSIGLQV